MVFSRVDDQVGGSAKIGKIVILPDDRSKNLNGFLGPKGVYQQLSLHSPPA